MTTLEAVLAEIAQGPRGPRVGAFFDLDGTLLSGYSAGAFYRERLRRGEMSRAELARTLAVAVDGSLLGGDPARLGPIAVDGLRGRSEDSLVELGERLFVQGIARTIRPGARELVRAHRRRGHTVVIASSATRFQVAPVARDLGIEHVLCTELETEDGLFTGELRGQMLWGEPKASAARAFARNYSIDLRRSFAYGNGEEDIPFLSTVGRPHPVNPQPKLERIARDQGWPVVALRDPPSGGVRDLARTLGAVGALNLVAAAGVGVGLVSGDRKLGANLTSTLGFDAALAIAGIRLRVSGEHNLWSARPAVFLMNHQSGLDPLIVGALVRRDFTGAGKKEAKYDPRSALLGRALNTAFLDRENPERAKEEMRKLVHRLHEGVSVVVAPEGTRTPTPVLRPFKKGAFHLAMDAGVPVVPIVLRNAGELMWRTARTMHPGTVDVAVLEPIPTDDWTRENLGERVEAVRERFVETLEHWPEERVAS